MSILQSQCLIATADFFHVPYVKLRCPLTIRASKSIPKPTPSYLCLFQLMEKIAVFRCVPQTSIRGFVCPFGCSDGGPGGQGCVTEPPVTLDEIRWYRDLGDRTNSGPPYMILTSLKTVWEMGHFGGCIRSFGGSDWGPWGRGCLIEPPGTCMRLEQAGAVHTFLRDCKCDFDFGKNSRTIRYGSICA